MSPKQQRILNFICNYIASHKEPPLIREIQDKFGMSSPASVHAHIVALEREGRITRTPNVSRGIRIVEQASHVN